MSTSPVVIGAENVAFLHLLHTVPAQPSKTNATPLLQLKEGYTLPFEVERNLTSTLAFLSCLDDDPNRIPAVCVLENDQKTSLNVLLAVNKAGPGGGMQVLQRIKEGFDEIFLNLSDTLERSEGSIFNTIILMCTDRILCRLRLIPNRRRTPKQALETVLQEAISTVKELLQSRIIAQRTSISATRFLEWAKTVIDLLKAWVNHQTPVKLAELVGGIYQLRQIDQLDKLLNTVPALQRRKSLLNIINKVARYREAARFLVRTAKKYPIVRQMNTILIDLPEAAFGNHLNMMSSNTLQDTISQLGGSSYNLGYICKLLQVDQSDACQQFTHQTEQTLRKAKIHAEIQLIFYLEQVPSNHPSRVICSSKDACFLCNMLVSIYGKVYTPRCHGRLYPGWKLPYTPFFTELQSRLNVMLQGYAKNSLETLIARRRKSSYPDPNESTLLTLPLSASTVNTEAEPQSTPDEVSGAKSSQLSLQATINTGGLARSLRAVSPRGKSLSNSSSSHSAKVGKLAGSEARRKESVVTAHNKYTEENFASQRDDAELQHSNDSEATAITEVDLPFRQRIAVDQQDLELRFDHIVFFFEFAAASHGYISILEADLRASSYSILNVADIPTHSELRIDCVGGTSQFYFFISPSLTLRFEFGWGN